MGDLYAEDLPGPALPTWAEEFLAGERAWHRLLRGAGLVNREEATVGLARWMDHQRHPRGGVDHGK